MKTTAVIMTFSVLLCLTVPARAEDNAFTKLGRGAANTLTGWLEIPKNIYIVSSERNPLLGVSYGLGKGVFLGMARTAVGLYEVVTFPFPLPADFRPIISPEYALEG